MVLHLLSIALFYGDYAIPYHFMNTNSQAHLAVKKNDVAALNRFCSRNWIDFELLTDEKREELFRIYDQLDSRFGEKLKTELAPLPTEYLIELGERAQGLGKFRDAHSAFKAAGLLEKRVNQLVTEAIQILSAKEISSGDLTPEMLEEKVTSAVSLVFQALRLKNPFRNQFQTLAMALHLEDAESMRKYNKYIEQSQFKEIIEFCIEFLIDDNAISSKISGALSSGKLRRLFLKKLAIRFSDGSGRYQTFVENYNKAVEMLQTASKESDYLKVQKILLGRGTGDNEYFQYLQELSVEHPIGSLLVHIRLTPEGKRYIAPIILKSDNSLLDFLEIS